MIMRPLLLQIYPYHYQMFDFSAQIVIRDHSFDKLNGLLNGVNEPCTQNVVFLISLMPFLCLFST